MQSKDSIKTVNDGEYPFYEQDDAEHAENNTPRPTLNSATDADTIQGLSAVTAIKAGPNKLVATGNTGVLPTSIMPGVSGSATSSNTLTVVNGVITAIS